MKPFVPLFFLAVVALCSGCANEILKGQVASAEAREREILAEQAETQNRLAALGTENQELLAGQAQAEQMRRRDAERIAQLEADRSQYVASFEQEKAQWQSEIERLREENLAADRRIAFQNASLRRSPTEIILPNHGRSLEWSDFDDPDVLPPRMDRRRICVEMQDRLIFSDETGKLSEEGKRRTAAIAQKLSEKYPDAPIRIEGHSARAKNTPRREPADSFQKANEVFEFLVNERGFPPDRLTVGGSGAADPILPETSPAARERNERIEMIVNL